MNSVEEESIRMNSIATALDKLYNGDKTGKDKDIGFVLLVFPYGQVSDGRVNYISNGANRRDIISLMKEMIARFEGQPEVTGHA
jgi:hypothetical protein